MPLFMTGFKDTNNGFGGDELLKKSIETNIILKMLFGRSSKFYKSLYEKGLINNRFSLEYTMQPDYAYSSIDGESSDPKAVYEAVINEVEETRKNGLSKEDFEKIQNALSLFELPTQMDGFNAEKVLSATKSDKKMVGNQVKFILLKEIGNAYIYRELTDEQILDGIRYVCHS